TVFFLITLANILGWRPFTAEIRNISCTIFEPEAMYLYVTTNKKVVNVNVTLLRTVSNPVVGFFVAHDSGKGNFNLVYANRTVDMCTFMKNRKSNVFLEIIFRILTKYGDLPTKCPMHKKRYEFLNVTINPETIPPMIPDHTAMISISFGEKINRKRNNFAKATFYFVIERSYKKPSNT
ncbi:hypothetical protein Bhyg_15920, partial [Pseudolycoriella hygida]